MDLDNHSLAERQRCCTHEQIDHLFHKLLNSIEERLKWCFEFMQGIFGARFQNSRTANVQSAQQAASRRGRGEGEEHSQRMTGEKKTDEKQKTDKIWKS